VALTPGAVEQIGGDLGVTCPGSSVLDPDLGLSGDGLGGGDREGGHPHVYGGV